MVVQAGTEANVRWANNTVTTNGFATSLSWFVVAVSGGAAGTVAASAASADSAAAVAEVAAAAHQAAKAAAQSGRAQDEQPLIEPGAARPGSDFADAPDATSFAVFGELLESLAAAFDGARSGERILYGFARHEMTTIYLGSSTGLRLRWVQPTGLLELNAKSADLQRSAWSGVSTADFRGVDVNRVADGLTTRLDWAGAPSTCRPAGTTPSCRRRRWPTSSSIWPGAPAPGRRTRDARRSPQPGGGTKIGQRLTDRGLNLFSDPAAPGLASPRSWSRPVPVTSSRCSTTAPASAVSTC